MVTLCRNIYFLNVLAFSLAPLMIVVSLVVAFALMCFRDLSKRVPVNYILLFSFTFAEATLLHTYLMQYNSELILSALLITGLVVVSLAYVAFTTKTELISSKNVLYFLMFHAIFGLVSLLFFSVSNVLISLLGAVVSSIYLIIDIQLMMKDKNVKLEIDEYIYAALNIYLDIIILFKKLLEILDAIQNNKDKEKK